MKEKNQKGVKISFLRPNENKPSFVYYFPINISNNGLDGNPRYSKFIKSINKNLTTMIKSASYCLHEDKFSKIRDLIINQSTNLIQDDSGIPFSYFDSKLWENNFYGIYNAPIRAFSNYRQDDYKQVFIEKAKQINFRFGYSYPSNLIVVRRK